MNLQDPYLGSFCGGRAGKYTPPPLLSAKIFLVEFVSQLLGGDLFLGPYSWIWCIWLQGKCLYKGLGLNKWAVYCLQSHSAVSACCDLFQFWRVLSWTVISNLLRLEPAHPSLVTFEIKRSCEPIAEFHILTVVSLQPFIFLLILLNSGFLEVNKQWIYYPFKNLWYKIGTCHILNVIPSDGSLCPHWAETLWGSHWESAPLTSDCPPVLTAECQN